jgi:hypothetical protein
MRIFYNKKGEPIGMIDGANEAIESGFMIEGAEAMVVPEEIASRIRDPKDSLRSFDVKKKDIVKAKQKPKK